MKKLAIVLVLVVSLCLPGCGSFGGGSMGGVMDKVKEIAVNYLEDNKEEVGKQIVDILLKQLKKDNEAEDND